MGNTEPIDLMLQHWDKVDMGLGHNQPHQRDEARTHLEALRDQGHTHVQRVLAPRKGEPRWKPVHPSTGVQPIEDAIRGYGERINEEAARDPNARAPYDRETMAAIYHPRVKALIDLQNQGFTHARWGRDYDGDEVNKWHGAMPHDGPTKYSVRKVAHDSGDGETIYHCPMCGSGQVIARSDRSVECQFCHTAFTVQIQPMYPSFPQTINGQPVQVPGMPGQIGVGDPIGGDPAGGDPGFPVDPDDVDEQGGIPGQDPEGEEPQGDDDSAEEQEAEEGNAPPWAKKSLRTTTGAVLPATEYVHHLAVRNARDRGTMAAIIKERR